MPQVRLTPGQLATIEAALVSQRRYFRGLARRAVEGDAVARQTLNAAEVTQVLEHLAAARRGRAA